MPPCNEIVKIAIKRYNFFAGMVSQKADIANRKGSAFIGKASGLCRMEPGFAEGDAASREGMKERTEGENL